MGKRVQKLLIYIFIKVSRDVVVPPLGNMCQVFVPKRNVICYIASQSHMTCMLVKLINDHGYKVLLINRTRYHVPPGFIGEQSFRAKKN